MENSIYVLNKHKGKLHKIGCKYVQVGSKNMVDWASTPKEALYAGYTICQECIFEADMDKPGVASRIEESNVTENGRAVAAASLFGGASVETNVNVQESIKHGMDNAPVADVARPVAPAEQASPVETVAAMAKPREEDTEKTQIGYVAPVEPVKETVPETAQVANNTASRSDEVPSATLHTRPVTKDTAQPQYSADDEMETDEEASADTIICPKCGQELQSNAAFCFSCGAKIKKTKVKSAKKSKKVRSNDHMQEVNDDDYYSPVEPLDKEEKYSTPVGETIAKIVFGAAGIAGAVLLAIFFI